MIAQSSKSMVKAVKLDDKGAVTGDQFYLLLPDVKDSGDGADTIDLSIPK